MPDSHPIVAPAPEPPTEEGVKSFGVKIDFNNVVTCLTLGFVIWLFSNVIYIPSKLDRQAEQLQRLEQTQLSMVPRAEMEYKMKTFESDISKMNVDLTAIRAKLVEIEVALRATRP